MKSIKILLRFVAPFKWQVTKNLFYNIISSFFALFVITLLGPFLKILFNVQEAAQGTGVMSFSLKSIGQYGDLFVNNLFTSMAS